ncbi:Eco57I restriction-modification methylase domain-containing protein [Paraclostridium bifermentans]|nr:Eco57I restriction-modification methylase domain-containing protein [Paraclostridium bifermentans]
MSKKYDVCTTNPPYMGKKTMGVKLSDYSKSNYVDTRTDLCTMFIEKCINYCKNNKYISMITMHSWMSFKQF